MALPMCRRAALMASSSKAFQADRSVTVNVCTFARGWRLCPSPPHLRFQFISANP
ncbi:unnamed protein product [Tetraodon nigroviridis]|uniref:(spotted green pufferfish) hypothetical protein n=1 Tax=Tetraodon nigroviridis TaxID=99883 RepID=Q4SKV7_TETNG|nr:unnamed protein product [Tetraodon nigroviridis]